MCSVNLKIYTRLLVDAAFARTRVYCKQIYHPCYNDNGKRTVYVSRVMKHTFYECDKICSTVDEFFQGFEIVIPARLSILEGPPRSWVERVRFVALILFLGQSLIIAASEHCRRGVEKTSIRRRIHWKMYRGDTVQYTTVRSYRTISADETIMRFYLSCFFFFKKDVEIFKHIKFDGCNCRHFTCFIPGEHPSVKCSRRLNNKANSSTVRQHNII